MCIILSFRKGSTLIIPSDMNLSFKENRGIYVEGKIQHKNVKYYILTRVVDKTWIF